MSILGGLLVLLSFVCVPAFIGLWWLKRKARLAAGDDYQNDEDYLKKSKLKRIVGIAGVAAFVLGFAIMINFRPSPEEIAAREKQNRAEFISKLDGDYKTLYDTKLNEYTSGGKTEEEAETLAVADVKTKQTADKKAAEEKAAAEKAAKEAEEKRLAEEKAAKEKAEREAKAAEEKRLAEEKAAQEKAEREAKAAAEQRAKAEKAQQEQNIKTVRGGNFYSHPNVPVGAAFQKFFENGKWTAFTSTEGEQVVQFVGDCLWYDERAKLTMQFVVNGNEFEMRHVNINDVTFSYEESVAQLDKILDEY